MTTYTHPFDQVREFHETFSIHNASVPSIPAEHVRDLRKRLLAEEYQEYLDGEEKNDIVEIADALADCAYIIFGTALAYGIPLDAIFNEVHRSNMSKLDATGNVLRREDGKIIKSDQYSPPDVVGILSRPVG